MKNRKIKKIAKKDIKSKKHPHPQPVGEPIYEPKVSNSSDGFRPNRCCDIAIIKALENCNLIEKGSYVELMEIDVIYRMMYNLHITKLLLNNKN